MPVKSFNCDDTIINAVPVVKPEVTGMDMKSTMNPRIIITDG